MDTKSEWKALYFEVTEEKYFSIFEVRKLTDFNL